ncbi:oocyte-expressed protein homolog [Choloepus didactylus]|uniref:oocyte-expressed protein homolog n=1 Tax=Choloepus didactylus TaxID=27675 RepID=UPI00189D7F15|nr:oocyte-expressed protein homolog [Choloepus didactylus]
MVDVAVAAGACPAEAQDGKQVPAAASQSSLLRLPRPVPRIRVRPWWFPVEELTDPLVFHLEAWLVDPIFGPDRATIPKIEWMSQALLMVDVVDSEGLAEITVFGRPRVRNRVKSVLLGLASSHRERRFRGEKMKRLEEFLKSRAAGPQTPQTPNA